MSVQAPEATPLDVAGVSTALIDVAPIGPRSAGTSDGTGAVALSIATARPQAVRRIVLMGSMGVAMAWARPFGPVAHKPR